MRPPCEQTVRYLLPQLRAHLSYSLQDHGWSQTKIAKELQTTQAAVSGYLKAYRPESEYTTPVFKQTVTQLVKAILENNQPADMNITGICNLCLSQRIAGPLCRQHKSDFPILQEIGCTVCNDFPPNLPTAQLSARTHVILALQSAFEQLKQHAQAIELLPEVRSNLVYALPDAESSQDVAGIPGRITHAHNQIVSMAPPEFGASIHTAQLLLLIKTIYPNFRAAFCIKANTHFLDQLKTSNILINAPMIPPSQSFESQLSTQLRAQKLPKQLSVLALHVNEQQGKEPIVYLFGKNPLVLVQTALDLLQ